MRYRWKRRHYLPPNILFLLFLQHRVLTLHFLTPVILNFRQLICIYRSSPPFQFSDDTGHGWPTTSRATSYPIPTATDLNWNLPFRGKASCRLPSRPRSIVARRCGAEDTEIVDRESLASSIRSNHRRWVSREGGRRRRDEAGGYFGERVHACEFA